MKISILERTTEDRGGHKAEVVVAHEMQPGETVQSLCERVLIDRFMGTTTVKHRSWIELRIAVEPGSEESA